MILWGELKCSRNTNDPITPSVFCILLSSWVTSHVTLLIPWLSCNCWLGPQYLIILKLKDIARHNWWFHIFEGTFDQCNAQAKWAFIIVLFCRQISALIARPKKVLRMPFYLKRFVTYYKADLIKEFSTLEGDKRVLILFRGGPKYTKPDSIRWKNFLFWKIWMLT